MADWTDVIKQIAPTVATALVGPLGGAAVAALGSIFGISEPTQDKIANAISTAQLTPDQIVSLKKLDLEYQQNEKELGFKYEELAFKDRDSARQMNVQGGTTKMLFWLSVLLLTITLGTEIVVLFKGLSVGIPDIVVGRVLGLMDAVATMVLVFWYGSSNGSVHKTELLAQAEPLK